MAGKLTQFGVPPKIWVSKRAIDKSRIWTDLAVGEVSWLGVVEEKYDNRDRLAQIRVLDCFLPEQTCTGSSTDIEPEMTAECMRQAEAAGYDSGALRYWGHSHVNMNVFWSKTDTDNMELLSNDANILSIVFNKRDEYRCRYDMAYPLRLVYDEMDVEFESNNPAMPDEMLKGLNSSAEMLGKFLKTTQAKAGLGHILAELKAIDDAVEAANKLAKESYEQLKVTLKEEFDRKVKSRVYTYSAQPGVVQGFGRQGQQFGGDFGDDWNPYEFGQGRSFGINDNGQVNVGLEGKKEEGGKEAGTGTDNPDIKSGEFVAEQLISGEISPDQAVYGIQEDLIMLAEDIEKKYPKVGKFAPWRKLRGIIEIGLENVGICLSNQIEPEIPTV